MNQQPQWEYHTQQFNVEGGIIREVEYGVEFTQLLNSLGMAGWELVSVFNTSSPNDNTPRIAAVFKQRLSN